MRSKFPRLILTEILLIQRPQGKPLGHRRDDTCTQYNHINFNDDNIYIDGDDGIDIG